MTKIDFSLLNELLGNELIKLGFFLLIMLLLYAGFVFTLLMLFDYISDKVTQQHQIKMYLQQHRFDRFRVKPFLKNEFIIVEYYGVNCPPLDVIHCKHFENADKICQILNCDFLDERYTEKKVLRLSTSSNAEDINHFKDPQNEGERS